MVNESIVKVTSENTENALHFTEEIVENYPGRIVGSESCLKTGKRIASEYTQYCDEGSVKIEEFSCHPRSFLKHIKFDIIMFILGTLLILLDLPSISIIPFSLALVLILSQMIFYLELFDPFFKKEKGQNVYGTLEPEGEVKQQIYICGHHDAAYVFPLMEKSPRKYPIFVIAGLIPFPLAIIYSIVASISGANPMFCKIILLISLLGVLNMWRNTSEKISPGAGDNMIASSIAGEIVKIFSSLKKNGDNPLKHTRIVCLSVDGEECGLRGSRAFVTAHKKELKDIKTYVFCIDTIFNADKLNFLNRDLNTFVPLSDNMANELVDIATAFGYGAKVSQMPAGGGATDSVSFARIGVETTCLLSFELDITKLHNDLAYHTPRDTVSAIEPEVVTQSLNIAVEYILKKDRMI